MGQIWLLSSKIISLEKILLAPYPNINMIPPGKCNAGTLQSDDI